MLKAVLFDLDGTLLPMDQNVFAKAYFTKLSQYICPLGYAPDVFMKGMMQGIGYMLRIVTAHQEQQAQQQE